MRQKIVALFVASLIACQADTARDVGGTRGEPPHRSAMADSALASEAGHVGSAAPETVPARNGRAAVLFLGTSLSAGYGVGAGAAYPALIQQRIDSAGLPYRVVNAGLSGETSAGGLERLEWSLQDSIAVLVLELGANDGLRGLPVDRMRANLDEILRRTRERYPDARLVIAGMEAPPNLGSEYTRAFRQVFPALARKYDAELIPFLLEGVAAEPTLNQEDGIHPNEQGHARIAERVWEVLLPVLDEGVRR
jgi:acyl-CoA thioesterase-1